MNPLVALIKRLFNRPKRQAKLTPYRELELIQLLARNEASEDFFYKLLMNGPASEANSIVSDILDLRQKRVAILRELGWIAKADDLEADNEMRRGRLQ